MAGQSLTDKFRQREAVASRTGTSFAGLDKGRNLFRVYAYMSEVSGGREIDRDVTFHWPEEGKSVCGKSPGPDGVAHQGCDRCDLYKAAVAEDKEAANEKGGYRPRRVHILNVVMLMVGGDEVPEGERKMQRLELTKPCWDRLMKQLRNYIPTKGTAEEVEKATRRLFGTHGLTCVDDFNPKKPPNDMHQMGVLPREQAEALDPELAEQCQDLLGDPYLNPEWYNENHGLSTNRKGESNVAKKKARDDDDEEVEETVPAKKKLKKAPPPEDEGDDDDDDSDLEEDEDDADDEPAAKPKKKGKPAPAEDDDEDSEEEEDSDDDDDEEEEETPPPKKKKGKPAPAEDDEEDAEDDDSDESEDDDEEAPAPKKKSKKPAPDEDDEDESDDDSDEDDAEEEPAPKKKAKAKPAADDEDDEDEEDSEDDADEDEEEEAPAPKKKAKKPVEPPVFKKTRDCEGNRLPKGWERGWDDRYPDTFFYKSPDGGLLWVEDPALPADIDPSDGRPAPKKKAKKAKSAEED